MLNKINLLQYIALSLFLKIIILLEKLDISLEKLLFDFIITK